MVANSSELLYYCHDCMVHTKYFIKNCTITSGVVVVGRRPPLNFKKSMLFSIYHKKMINFRSYSLIHINIMINLESMHLIYPY